MGILEKLRSELIDVVEWLDGSRDTMVHRFARYQNEIKMGAKLVVRESQAAVFVNEGRLADIFEPGTHTLSTRNLPILRTLLSWKYGFDSPFKAEVYFINTRRFVDLKWGTASPIMLRDAEFGPVRLRAYGTYCVRVSNPQVFMQEIVGTDPSFRTEHLTDQLRNMIVARFSDLLAESKLPILDLAANYDELGRFASERLHDQFQGFGLDLDNFLVENISLPPAVEKALDKRTEMGLVGDLDRFTQYQAASAMEAAARNPSGGGSEGIGLGMGLAMGQKMTEAFAGGTQAGSVQHRVQPPPIPAGAPTYFLGVEGQQLGPYDLGVLRHEIVAGRLKASTLIWTPGMPGWEMASNVKEVAALLATGGPPPLPPQ